MDLRYTLLADGSSDKALMPLIDWVLRAYGHPFAIQSTWADLYRLPHKPKGLAKRIRASVDLYPCDILFIHRDAEREPYSVRAEEIHRAVKEARDSGSMPEYICVVPVRMQEAWILCDEHAIRQAAGNPNGSVRLNMPPMHKLEALPNPKAVLYDLLEKASELTGRQLARLDIPQRTHRVAELIGTFDPLRQLSAFRRFEEDVKMVVDRLIQAE